MSQKSRLILDAAIALRDQGCTAAEAAAATGIDSRTLRKHISGWTPEPKTLPVICISPGDPIPLGYRFSATCPESGRIVMAGCLSTLARRLSLPSKGVYDALQRNNKPLHYSDFKFDKI